MRFLDVFLSQIFDLLWIQLRHGCIQLKHTHISTMPFEIADQAVQRFFSSNFKSLLRTKVDHKTQLGGL